MRGYFIVLTMFFMAGCATEQTFELAEYERFDVPPYPPISFTLNDGYVDSGTSCTQYGCYSYRDNSDFLLISALRNTKLFERIDVNNADSEYTLDIKFYDKFVDSDGAELSSSAIASSLLSVIPTQTAKKVHFSVSIRHKNEIVNNYLYEDEYSHTNSLFMMISVDPQSGSRNALEYFVSMLMRDIQEDGVFSQENLGASSP